MRVLIVTVILFYSGSVYSAESERIKPRLKFKNGPVCMCTDGLSEKDIRARRSMINAPDAGNTTKQTQQLQTSQERDTEDK